VTGAKISLFTCQSTAWAVIIMDWVPVNPFSELNTVDGKREIIVLCLLLVEVYWYPYMFGVLGWFPGPCPNLPNTLPIVLTGNDVFCSSMKPTLQLQTYVVHSGAA